MKEKFTVRPATVKEINRIFELTNQMAEKGLMLTRSKYKIISILQNFLVAVDENDYTVGCGAFSLLWSDLGEIMALAVDPLWQKKGVGSELVKALISRGYFVKVPEIIVLTYQVEFFKKLGFILTDKDKFPRKVWRECLECPKLENCDETAMHMIL
ncbi:MAG: N-acetyltransferase [Spirochaetia bacterium]|jgi:amino-acid N-acetyltransferase|nr:N-acetyltransferase [Spirochaetia bacterium]